MKIVLDEADYLTFQLYTASKTPRVRRARIRSWVMWTITFAVLSYSFYGSANHDLGLYFLVMAGLSLALFPFYTRWRYKKHYQGYVRENYGKRFGQVCELGFDADAITAKDVSGEARLNRSEIEVINELRDYYFIKMRHGSSLIIPRNKAGENRQIDDEVRAMVTMGVKHTIELDWKWR